MAIIFVFKALIIWLNYSIDMLVITPQESCQYYLEHQLYHKRYYIFNIICWNFWKLNFQPMWGHQLPQPLEYCYNFKIRDSIYVLIVNYWKYEILNLKRQIFFKNKINVKAKKYWFLVVNVFHFANHPKVGIISPKQILEFTKDVTTT